MAIYKPTRLFPSASQPCFAPTIASTPAQPVMQDLALLIVGCGPVDRQASTLFPTHSEDPKGRTKKRAINLESQSNAGLVYIDAGGATCTGSCLTTGDFCAASGLMIPTTMVVVPAGRLMVLCTSPGETKAVATSAPATCNCVLATKPEPSTSTRKVLPSVA
jgi:hypothetical protein